MTGINLLLIRDGSTFDITNLVENVSLSGRTGASFRTLSGTLLDDDGHNHSRSGIDVENGNQCIFSLDGTELFRGMLYTQSHSNSKTLPFKAYDNGVKLKDNKDTFSYSNKTVSEIFVDICKRFGLTYADDAHTSFRIPELIKSNVSAFDCLADALSQDFKATGIRKFISSEKGVLRLTVRRDNIKKWVIENDANLISYSYSVSIENVKTRLKMLSKEDAVIAQKTNSALEKKIGIAQEINTPDEGLNSAQLNALVNSMLEDLSTPQRDLTVEALGIPDVISGVGVYIIIKELGLSRVFYVDEDNHEWKNGLHTMKLKLNFATDINKVG